MSLVNTYKEYIIEKIMLDYLKAGIIPTKDKIEADLVEYMKSHPDLSLPLSKYKDFSVERGGSSSASHVHEIAEVLSQDIGVIAREIYKVAKLSSRFYDRWSSEAKRLSAKAKNLEQRIDSLLLLNEDTAGFFSYVGDIFYDMNSINIEETSAKVDTYEGTVSLNPIRSNRTDASGGAQINLNELIESQVKFSVVTNRPGTDLYEPLSDENALVNIFKSDNSTWEGRVTSSSTGEMVTELKVNLADKDHDLTKVSFRFQAPIGTTRSTASLQYSTDGYTWYLVSSAEATKPLSKKMTWTFPKTSIRWLKFIIRKGAPDEGNDYLFSASHIKVFGNVFQEKDLNLFFSKPLQALDNQDNPVKFSLVSLDACADIPTNTSVNYYISASKNNINWTDWIAIAPSDQKTITYPKVVNIGGVNWKENKTASSVTKFDDTVSQRSLTKTFDDSVYGYRFKSNSYGVVNTAIPISLNEDPDPIASSVQVWRNVRDKSIYPDFNLVRGVQRGWGYDGGQYSCYFEVVSSDGIILDFGDKPCILDGSEVFGIVSVPQGVHKFTTDLVNWFDISEDIDALEIPITTDELLQQVDPLYPHNHKLVIEGFPYPTGNEFTGERVYLGTDVSAEFYATKVSLFGLENNVTDYGSFAVRGVGDAENPTLAVVTNFDSANSDNTNELFNIRWRSGEDDAELYTYIKLKAELWTEDASVTPMIQSYRLKLGI